MDLRLNLRIPGLFLALCLISGPAAASTWSRTYGGAGTDAAYAVRQTSDGGYIVAGETSSFGAGGTDMWVIKLDGGGNVQWEKTFGGAGNEVARSIMPDSGGGYIVAGNTNSFGAGGEDMWVLRLSAAGAVQWERTYGSALGNEIAYSVREKPGGGYVIAGRTDDIMGTTQPPDVLVIDLDSSGNVVWQNVYGGISDMQNEARAMALTDDDSDGMADDGMIVVGLRLGMLATDFDFWAVKMDSTGIVQWEQTFDSALALLTGDTAFSVQQTSDGGYVIAGENPSNNSDFWIIKLDSNGIVQWSRSHGSASGDAAFGVEQTIDGGYIAGGFTTVNGNDAFLVKLDSLGGVQWQTAYGGLSTDQARAVQQTADGGYIAAGFADSFGSGTRDLWVFKTDLNGDLDANCAIVTPTSFMLTSTGLAAGNAMALSAPASAAANSSTATTSNTSLSRNTQCSGLAQAGNNRVTQPLNGDHEQECALAIHPTNVNRQAVAYMDDPTVAGPVRFPSIGISYTIDGGVTWNDRQVQFGCDGIDDDSDGLFDEEIFCDGMDDDFDGLMDEDLCCNLIHIDPSIAADTSGNLYAAFVAHEPLASISFQGSVYVVAAKSTDGGNSWTTFPPVDKSVFTPPNPPNPPADFLDKSWLVVDNHPASPRTGTAYIAWQRDDAVSGTFSNVWVSSLTPGGTAWSTPVQVNGAAQQCADAAYPVAGIAGDLWVIWRHSTSVCGGGGQFWLDRSMDGGLTWMPGNIQGASYTPIPQSLYQHSYRTSDFPFLTVDPTNPQALYVVYSEDPTGTDEADVVFQRSLVGGGAAGWLGTAIKINDDSTMEPQYFPVARAKQNSNGWTILDVLWADERNNIGCRIDDDSDGVTDEETADMVDEDSDGLTDEDLCTIQIDIYFSRSVDTHSATPTFSPNKRITTLSFGAPQVPPNFLGDYVDMLPFGSDDYAVWADTRGGDNDVYWDRIGDMDSDSDGTLDFPDCNPSDATVIAGPSVVQSVTVSKSGSNASVTWTSQDPTAGTGTVYDIVTGLVSQLKASGNYSNATCLVNNHGNTPYLDTRTPPPSGDAYYYLLRAHNSCGIGSFGSTGPADPRYALEGSTPCAQ